MKSYQNFLLAEGKIDATKFEGDLLAAMGSKDPGSTNADWSKKEDDHPAKVLAKGIVKKMKKGLNCYIVVFHIDSLIASGLLPMML